jgi:hypothetical protein
MTRSAQARYADKKARRDVAQPLTKWTSGETRCESRRRARLAGLFLLKKFEEAGKLCLFGSFFGAVQRETAAQV